MDCHKSKCVHPYYFDIPYHHSLLNDTFSLGDTIWITSDFGPQLKDTKTGELCTFDSIDFRGNVNFCEISGSKQRVINEKFTLISVTGSATLKYFIIDTNYASGNGSFYDIEYEGTSKYKLKLGFIAMEKGLYIANIGYPDLDRGSEFIETKCAGDINIVGAADGKDTAANNFHLTSYSTDHLFKNISLDVFQNNGMFCFVVK